MQLHTQAASKACVHAACYTTPRWIFGDQGAYRDDNGKPVVLEVVKEAEKRLTGRGDHEYLPIGGLKSFIEKSVALAYGEDAACIKEKRVAAVQTLSGTGQSLMLVVEGPLGTDKDLVRQRVSSCRCAESACIASR